MTKEIINKTDNEGRTAFWCACASGGFNVVNTMLDDERVDINIGDKYNSTPLMEAIKGRFADIALLLLKSVDKHKIELNATSFNGETALDLAKMRINGQSHNVWTKQMEDVVNAIEKITNATN